MCCILEIRLQGAFDPIGFGSATHSFSGFAGVFFLEEFMTALNCASRCLLSLLLLPAMEM